MAVAEQLITDRYAIYSGDCMDVVPTLPAASVHLSVYSPPFAGLYAYSSSERDFSNCLDYDEFMEQYGYLVREMARVTMPGRITAVHCTDVPSGNSGDDHLRDFPGDIVRLHEREGWLYIGRYAIWKDPFVVYLRTMQKNIQHKTVISDAARCSNANADYLVVLRKAGKNPIPIEHSVGLTDYAGALEPPAELLRYRGHPGKQTENKYSQWIWRRYASAFWDDVRLDRVLPYQRAKDADDEKHVHPLQLDVIDRCVQLWSNPDEVVLTPFMGVGSEVYSAVMAGRRALGVELKPSYYRQAVANLTRATEDAAYRSDRQLDLFAGGATA